MSATAAHTETCAHHPPYLSLALSVPVPLCLCLSVCLQIDLVSKAISSPPVFILHGEKDTEIPSLHAQQLYERASHPFSLWLVGEAGHNDVEVRERAEYWKRLDEFVRFVEAKVDSVDVVERRTKDDKRAGKAKVK